MRVPLSLPLFLLLFCIPGKYLSAQRLTDSLTTKIDNLFSKYNMPNSPGAVIGIVRNDSLIYTKAFGAANLEYSIPNSPETIFHIASISKQFAAYAIVLLAKQGRLTLDDDIRKYLPWFPDLKEIITIRHLLNHTSGIRDQWQLLAISGTRLDDVITQDHIVRLLGKQQRLNFKPGSEFNYSNSGFTMVAEIVKTVTGKSLRQFCDSAIFKPLGMNSTHFRDDYREIVKNRAYSYGRISDDRFINNTLSYSTAGATSLLTNVRDLSKWVMNFYINKVGTQQDIAQLNQRTRLNNNKELPYALGITVNTYKGWKYYSHGGSDAGYRAFINVFPDLKLGIIVFANVGEINTLTKSQEIMDIIIKDSSKVVAAAVVIDSSKSILTDLDYAKQIAGNYISDAGVRFSFKLKDQKLYWDRPAGSDLLLKQKDTFVVASAPEVKFVFDKSKPGDTVVNQYWPEGQRLMVKNNFDPVKTDQQLQAYAGTYYSAELDTRYTISVKDNGLVLYHEKYGPTGLKLISHNNLVNDFWWMGHLKVVRDSKNQVVGFDVNAGRIMYLRFDKSK